MYISAVTEALTHFINVDSWSHLAKEALKLVCCCGQLEIHLSYYQNCKSVRVDSRSHLATDALKLLYSCGQVEIHLNCYQNCKSVRVDSWSQCKSNHILH